MIRRFCAAVLLLLAAAGAARAEPPGTPGAFDFYILALSWSPTYCAEQTRTDGAQCRSGRPFGFIVHGLWPQHERGYPQSCQTPPPFIPAGTLNDVLDLMPSRGLVIHEWRRHGTCSGLTPDAFFAKLRAAREKITIPPAFVAPTQPSTVTPAEVEAAFIAANPGLTSEMIAVDCGANRLREVRVCFSKDLAFRPCPEADRRGCRAGRALEVPPVQASSVPASSGPASPAR
ncbi:ribonuclease T2 family protein [Roseixanthobacter liquoris]|uniref:ribonuclease T2 family protein n=1 Tax=Roseixanthobacter liquoris TaxID=3119921 RepID=UPI00372C6CAA